MPFIFGENEAEATARLAKEARLAQISQGGLGSPLPELKIPTPKEAAMLNTKRQQIEALKKVDEWIAKSGDEINRIAAMTDDIAREMAEKNYLKAVEAKMQQVAKIAGDEAAAIYAERQTLQLSLNIAKQQGTQKAAAFLNKATQAFSSFGSLGGGLAGKVIGEFWLVQELYGTGQALLTGNASTSPMASLASTIASPIREGIQQAARYAADATAPELVMPKDVDHIIKPKQIDNRLNTPAIGKPAEQIKSFPEGAVSGNNHIPTIKHNPTVAYKNQVSTTNNAPVRSANLAIPKPRLDPPKQQINYTIAGQTSTRTTPKPIQSISSNIDEKRYGMLTHEPISSKVELIKTTKNDQFLKSWEEQQKEVAKMGITHINWNEEAQGKSFAEAHPNISLDNTAVTFISNPTTHEPMIVWGGTGISDLYRQWNQRAEHNTPGSIKTHISTALAIAPVTITAATVIKNAVGGGGGITNNPITAFKPTPGTSNITNKVKQIRDSLVVSRMLDLLSLALAINNGIMLSTNLVQSCTQILDDLVSLTGFNKINDKEITFSEMLSSGLNKIFVNIVGVQNAKEIRVKWMRLNNIWQSANTLHSSIMSIGYGTQALIEVVGSGMGKIGNALKSAGIVHENAYSWLSEELTTRYAKYDKYFQSLDNMDELANRVNSVTSNTRSIRDTAKEIPKQTEELKKEINKYDKKITDKDLEAAKYSDPLEIPETAEKKS